MRNLVIENEAKVRFSSSKNPDLAKSYATVMQDLGLKCKTEKDVLGGVNVIIEPQELSLGHQENILLAILADKFVPVTVEYR